MIIKWVGSKRNLIPEIIKHIPNFSGSYFEPFFGAGHVFFNICSLIPEPKVAFLNDKNKALYKMWLAVELRSESLIDELWLLKKEYEALSSEAMRKRFYYAQRDLYNIRQTPARLIFLNKVGFNGLYRVNQKGGFNVPYGQRKKFSFSPHLIRECHEKLDSLTSAVLMNGDWRDTIDIFDRDDFSYFDPPYFDDSGNNFTAYTKDGFNQNDYLDIKTFMLDCSGKVLLSCPDTEWMRTTFHPFNIITVESNKSVSRDSKSRGKKSELLIKNY